MRLTHCDRQVFEGEGTEPIKTEVVKMVEPGTETVARFGELAHGPVYKVSVVGHNGKVGAMPCWCGGEMGGRGGLVLPFVGKIGFLVRVAEGRLSAVDDRGRAQRASCSRR